MRFVLIPPGAFTMGGTGEDGGTPDERPQHEVEITKPFYLAIHETTNAHYRRFDEGHIGAFDGSDGPVETVSYLDVTRFIDWLRRQDSGRDYRLPTEAEWEYACRAGTATPFSFGETITTDQANYNGSRYPYGSGAKGVHRGQPTPVGTFPANRWGLHDMHGNLFEWCADAYAARYYDSSGRMDPKGPHAPTDHASRVMRGGSWDQYAVYLRSAFRRFGDPDSAYANTGFRLVVALP